MNNKKKYYCSGYMSKTWDYITGDVPKWEHCCKDHDEAYEDGDDRKSADKKLCKCVKEYSYFWAGVMWIAVRIAGAKARINAMREKRKRDK